MSVWFLQIRLLPSNFQFFQFTEEYFLMWVLIKEGFPLILFFFFSSSLCYFFYELRLLCTHLVMLCGFVYYSFKQTNYELLNSIVLFNAMESLHKFVCVNKGPLTDKRQVEDTNNNSIKNYSIIYSHRYFAAILTFGKYVPNASMIWRMVKASPQEIVYWCWD